MGWFDRVPWKTHSGVLRTPYDSFTMTASKNTRLVIGSIIAAMAFVVASILVLAAVQPFRMVIEPHKNGAVVQFHDPGHRHVSPPFQIASSVTVRREIILDSGDVDIPGAALNSQVPRCFPADSPFGWEIRRWA